MEKYSYIHPKSGEIIRFAETMQKETKTTQELIANIFQWFNENISYSRLNAPYFPLQRSDLDVLAMKSGTCGDYSNLIVSVLLCLGYQAKYAYIKRDCYGNLQDHICAAVQINDEFLLIDATMPYRKWMGYHCPHMEFELYTPMEFEHLMKKEETHWINVAREIGSERLAGLLYAPWIHDETIISTDNELQSVFFLLENYEKHHFKIYVNYFVYSNTLGRTPVMCTIDNKICSYRFSIKETADIWDASQWSKEYKNEEIPSELLTDYYTEMQACINRNMDRIDKIIQDAVIAIHPMVATADQRYHNNTVANQNFEVRRKNGS